MAFYLVRTRRLCEEANAHAQCVGVSYALAEHDDRVDVTALYDHTSAV